MDNLTAQKKLKLVSDCIKSESAVGLVHLDVKKMYAYLAEQTCNATSSTEIACLEVAKTTLDFLVKRAIK